MIRLRETKKSWIVECDGFSPFDDDEEVLKVAFWKSVHTKKDVIKIAKMGINKYINDVFGKEYSHQKFFRLLERRKI